MRSLIHHWILAVAVLALCGYPATSRAADPETEARERYGRALQLYEDGAYDAALVELKRAAELRPSYKLFYNIGQVELALNDYAAALQAYRRYLSDGGEHIQPARREAVQKEIDKLIQRVASVTIKTDVDGAEVYVDDSLAGTTPLAAPILVNSGVRRVTVRHPDYLPQSRQLALAGGAQEKVSIFLVTSVPAGAASGPAPSAARETPSARAQAAVTAPAASSPRPDAGEKDQAGPNRTWQWIGWGLTGALAVGAGVTGAVALSKNSELSDARDRPGVGSDELNSKASEVRTMAIVTDTLIAAAVVAGGVSLWLTLRSSDTPEKSAGHVPPSRSPVAIGLGIDGVRVRGSF
jgi:hypothetical protein